MRIALIISSNLYVSPYALHYTEILKKLGVQYDIISWNRLGTEEIGVVAFNLICSDSNNLFSKLTAYFRYRSFVKAKLREGNYDKVVVFTTVNTLMLFPFLKKRYKNNYVFDIRDHSVVLKLFRHRFSAAIKNSALTVISSAGFKRWLPKAKRYVIGHNTHISRPLDTLCKIEGQDVYKIITIGSLRDYQSNRILIEQLKNSPAFKLEYVGSGPAGPLLEDHVKSNGINNVNFFGRYLKEDEPKRLQGASLINILTDEDINSMTLMSNRFYLSLIYGVPMIVNDHSEQARLAKKYNLGVVIDRSLNIRKQIVQYLQTFDSESFNVGRKACLEIVQKDTNEFQSKFKEYVLDS